jgi:hypothetical protein
MFQKKILKSFLFVIGVLFIFFTQNSQAKFSSSVAKTEIGINDTFNLTLKLESQEHLFEPKISSLSKNFHILSTSKSSKTSIINGNFNSSLTWIVTLQPKKKGKIIISAISISTKNGEFTTNPIYLNITNKQKNNTQKKAQISTKISNKSPFRNESINLSIIINSSHNLYDISIEDFTIEGFIINNNRDIKSSRKNINGVQTNIIEVNYLITPIKSGKFKLNPIEVVGMFIDNNTSMSQFNSFFNRVSGRKFSIKSKPIYFNVKKPIANFDPWIPAQKISIVENELHNKEFEVGKPISRKFTISTKGISITQIPPLLSDFDKIKNLKIYKNKPETNEEIINNIINGSRTEEYSIVPQAPGRIKLPEIKLKWWDVKNKKIQFAKISEKIINVKNNYLGEKEDPIKEISSFPNKNTQNSANLNFLSILATLSMILNFILVFLLIKKKQKLENYSHIKGNISDIKKLNNVEELEIFIQKYIEKILNRKLSIEKSMELLSKESASNNNKKKLNQILKNLNQKIEEDKYGRKKINMALELAYLESELPQLKFTKKTQNKNNIRISKVDIKINP